MCGEYQEQEQQLATVDENFGEGLDNEEQEMSQQEILDFFEKLFGGGPTYQEVLDEACEVAEQSVMAWEALSEEEKNTVEGVNKRVSALADANRIGAVMGEKTRQDVEELNRLLGLLVERCMDMDAELQEARKEIASLKGEYATAG